MAIRDEKGVRLKIVDEISDELKVALKPIFEKAMKIGITPEEFVYLTIEEADLLSLCYIRHIG